MNVGGYQGLRARSGLRSAVNARLEEISFRTGLISATIALVALSAIVAAGVYVAALGHGSPVSSVTRAANDVKAPAAKTVAVPASALPRPPAQASPTPTARQPATADAASSQPAAETQPLAQAGSSAPAGSRDYGHASFSGHGPSLGGRAPGRGGFGFPGPGAGLGRTGGIGGMAGRHF